MKKVFLGISTSLLAIIGAFASVTIAYALQSSHYQFNETTLGGFGTAKTSSTNYQAASTAGILGFDSSISGNMEFKAGGTTTSDPALAFAVDSTSTVFAPFSTSSATVTTSTFEVKDYTSYGYIVQIFGTPPTNGTHSIAPMATTGPSTVGAEQFGINLVANTSPSSVGSNPDHGQFGFGDPTSNYNTPNNYRYVSGETIANGPKSSGYTIYTISYMVNVDSLTIGGQYVSNQTILCTATF